MLLGIIHTFNVDLTTLADPVIVWLNRVVPNIPLTILGILIGVLAVRMFVRITRYFLKLTTLPKGLRQIIASIIETVLWLILLIQVLTWLGFGNIVVFFSSSALAIGILLAAGGSTLLSDLVAGIFLARDTDFNVGDEIRAGENAVEGVIESMDVRRVRIRDRDGLLHVLPNSIVERKEWVVLNRRPQVTPLMKTAKRIKSVALETKAAVERKKSRFRKNDQ
jgi:small-conductance mechanosensitive channel